MLQNEGINMSAVNIYTPISTIIEQVENDLTIRNPKKFPKRPGRPYLNDAIDEIIASLKHGNLSVYYIYNTAQHIIIRVPLHYWNKKEKNDFLAENDDFEIKISLHLLLGAIVHQLELLESWLFSKQSESEASLDWVNVPDIAFGFKGHENHEYLSKKEGLYDFK